VPDPLNQYFSLCHGTIPFVKTQTALYTLAAEFIVRGDAWVRKIEYGAAGSDWKKSLNQPICLPVSCMRRIDTSPFFSNGPPLALERRDESASRISDILVLTS
jgi:hypothetical protein